MNHPEWQGTTEREYNILAAMDDGGHESNMRKIQLQTLMTDLIATDPYLSQQDPEAVLDAYNDLIEVNPGIAGKKALVAKLLREYMATEGLDTNIGLQLADDQRKTDDAKARKKTQATAEGAEYLAERTRQKEREEDREREQAWRCEDIRRETEEADRNYWLSRGKEEGRRQEFQAERVTDATRRREDQEREDAANNLDTWKAQEKARTDMASRIIQGAGSLLGKKYTDANNTQRTITTRQEALDYLMPGTTTPVGSTTPVNQTNQFDSWVESLIGGRPTVPPPAPPTH